MIVYKNTRLYDIAPEHFLPRKDLPGHLPTCLPWRRPVKYKTQTIQIEHQYHFFLIKNLIFIHSNKFITDISISTLYNELCKY